LWGGEGGGGGGGGGEIEHKMCFDFFLQLLSETFLILRIIQRDIFIHVRG